MWWYGWSLFNIGSFVIKRVGLILYFSLRTGFVVDREAFMVAVFILVWDLNLGFFDCVLFFWNKGCRKLGFRVWFLLFDIFFTRIGLIGILIFRCGLGILKFFSCWVGFLVFEVEIFFVFWEDRVKKIFWL